MASLKRSALAPKTFPKVSAIKGVALKTARAGIKSPGRDDLLLVTLDRGTTVAGVFTRSATASAPVQWSRKVAASGKARAILINSGNANTFTGAQGVADVRSTAAMAARTAGCRPNDVLIASTGVIGEPLPVNRIENALLRVQSSRRTASWLDAARAIGTTDTYPKGAMRRTCIGDTEVSLCGIAKGSGMIAPDMATMLAFFFTDADLPPSVLRQLVNDNLPSSFNAITVDSDTSTSDTVLLIATGARKLSGKPIRSIKDPRLKGFNQSLKEAMQELAQQIVRDGEGATKFITVNVSGAADDASARLIALAIANSPLVKTAIAGEDPNWGRVVMAVGKSGEPANRDRLKVKIGDFNIAKNGRVIANYDERPVAKYMKGREIVISVDVGIGKGSARVWTSDLTHEYISINADYRS